MSLGLSISIALLLVLLNGFFVAAEFALVKVRSTRISELAREGKATAMMALHEIHHLDAYLSACQLGITLASIGLGWVGEPAFAGLLHPLFERFSVAPEYRRGIAFAVGFIIISSLHIIVGELAPKSWAIQRAETVTLGVAYPLHWFYRLFKPLIFVLNGLSNLILRMFGLRAGGDHDLGHSEEELRMILTASGQSGVLKDSEVLMVKQVFEFADKNASDVMVPRVDMIYLDVDEPFEKNVQIAQSHPYSRYPICKGDADTVVGLIHIKELQRLSLQGKSNILEVSRDIMSVPESKPLDALLREFQRRKTHMALVVDEYGGTAGIVTLEDVLEQIVGEIVDEYDVEEPEVQQIGENVWRVSGRKHIGDLNNDIGCNIEEDEYDTLGGFLSGRLGRPPKRGDRISQPGWDMEVAETDGRRVEWAILRRQMTLDTEEEAT